MLRSNINNAARARAIAAPAAMRPPMLGSGLQQQQLARTASRPIFSWLFPAKEEEPTSTGLDTSVYEVRAYHHNEDWNSDTKAR